MIRFLKNNWIFILSSLLLIFPALFSKFPLVFSDTGTYIGSSVTFIPPVDRPLGYGLFINVFSWKYSLWPVILVQGMMATFLIWNMVLLILKNASDKFQKMSFISVVVLLAIASSLPWYAAQIMPDVLISFGVLATLLLFLDRNDKRWKRVIYVGIVLLCFITHFSHFLILFLALGTVLFFHRRNKISPFYLTRRKLVKPVLILSMGIISFFFMSISNYLEFNKFSPSASTYVFLTGRLAESGILERYLKDKCTDGSNDFCGLCSEPETLRSTNDLIWSGHGVLARQGWNWIKADSCLKPLFYDVISTPEYFFYFSYDCMKNTMVQMFQVNIGGGLMPYREDSAPYFAIDNHLWAEKNYYIDTAQYNDSLKMDFFRVFNYLLIVISVFLFAYYFIYQKLSFNENVVFKFLFLCYFFNAFITASLANVYDRLQARMTWPLVLLAILILIRLGRDYFSKHNFDLIRDSRSEDF